MSTAGVRDFSLDEKISLLAGLDFWQTRPLPHRDLPALWLSDGPHGLRKPARGDSPGLTDAQPATCFPTASALASSWDPELLERVGQAIGREARALGVGVVLGPGLNIKRHPCGGRNFEYLSEDPLLSGTLAAAMVRGIQGQGVAACLKHFVANNQESHRMVVDVLVDERSLRELYLRGFEIAVEQGAPLTVMAAYNKVNGRYACEHGELLGVLRDEWGFDGLVMSDWGAVDDRVAAVAAGCDLEMPTSHGVQEPRLLAAVREGRLPEAAVDRCVQRLLALQALVRCDLPPVQVDHDAHHALAREAAAASCVLLRNEGALLPLDPGTSVAVIGTLAKEPRYQGAGSSGVVPTRLVSAWDALTVAMPEGVLSFSRGYDPAGGAPDQALVDEALASAAQAEVALVFAGLPPAYESEGFDREHILLPPGQDALIRALAATHQRVVVVLCNGAPVAMPWVDQVGSVLEAYLGGQAAGEGIADVLLGRHVPSARLAESFVHRVEDHASHACFPGDGRQVGYREGLYVGYRWLDSAGIEPLFPFGHGLSYTRFGYHDLRVELDDEGATVHLALSNEGDRAGAEVVQLYLHHPQGRVYRPAQELRAFTRVELDVGERREISLRLERRAFACWCVHEHRWTVEGGPVEFRVGASSRDIRLRARVGVPPDPQPPEAWAPPCYHSPSNPLVPTDTDFARLLGRPLPAPQALRPFHRNSTFGQVRDTSLGGLLYRIALYKAERLLGVDRDPSLGRMAVSAVREMPLRALATTAGLLSWRSLDALLAWLDGRRLEALRILSTRRGPSG